jgi:hypothetical protein
MKTFVIVVGIGLALLGVFLGTSDLDARDGSSSVRCGSPFSPQWDYAGQADSLNRLAGRGSTDLQGLCQAKTDSRKTIATLVVGVGVVVAIGGLFVPTSGRA